MSDITEQRFVTEEYAPDADSELHKIPVLNDEEELIEMNEEFAVSSLPIPVNLRLPSTTANSM